MSIERLGVIGGGAWGTALAQVAASGGRDTVLWAMESDVVEAINAAHENPVYLPPQRAIKISMNLGRFGKLASLPGLLELLASKEEIILAFLLIGARGPRCARHGVPEVISAAEKSFRNCRLSPA